jgi:hypothetical protein
VLTSGANVPDISRALPLLDGVPPIKAVAAGHDVGSRRCWPTRAMTATPSAAPASNAAPNRSSRNARPPASTAWAKLRYVVEQTFALLHQFRRLAVRWERYLNLHDGLVSLAWALICWRRLINWTDQRSC